MSVPDGVFGRASLKSLTLAQLEEMLGHYRPSIVTDGWGDGWESGLFVRWSSDPTGDCARAYSLNHATGESEMGLSCCELLPGQTWHGLDTGASIGARIAEYRLLSLGTTARPWILEGYRPAGHPERFRGSDNEPLVRWPRAIGWVEV